MKLLDKDNEQDSGETKVDKESSSGESPTKKNKRRNWLPLLLVPFFVGCIWHTLHPLVSVFTGDMVPRRWYIDENSLEPSYFRMDFQYDLNLMSKTNNLVSPSLCQAISTDEADQDAISCYRHQDHFEILRILPTAGAVGPVTEAIVLVVPKSENWATGSQFHASVLQLVRRLSRAPWLAKTILVVTPVTSEASLAETVNVFLDSYLGTPDRLPGRSLTDLSLPTSFTGAMLRNLLVLESITTTSTDTPASQEIGSEIRILPQGRRGVLPNMDFTFLTMFVYSRSSMATRKRLPYTLVMHPYREKAHELWTRWIQPRLTPEFHDWARKLTELVLFEYTLAMGPYPPHASALNRGIDSLTIQAVVAPTGPQQQQSSEQALALDTAELVQKMEPILRSLSNLHERLHHSTSLYLLTSPERFVKHEEYLVPNLLLLIPLVIRAIALVLFDIDQFHWGALQGAVLWTVFGTVGCNVGLLGLPVLVDGWAGGSSWAAMLLVDRTVARQHFVVTMVYAVLLFGGVLLWRRGQLPVTEKHYRESIQFLACLWALAVHVPIAFGHVSLAFPSALVWTPLIAFLSCRENSGSDASGDQKSSSFEKKKTNRLVDRLAKWIGLAWSIGLLLTIFPCSFLVPQFFPEYTIYVRYGYLPLHLLLTLLHLSKGLSMLSKGRK